METSSTAELMHNISVVNTTMSECMGAADILSVVVILVLVLLAVVGNIAVMLSVFLYRRMRTFTNMLLVSLATADFLVGLLIMPFSATILVRAYWGFGALSCKIYATTDVLLCTASILNLCVISLDRYVAILYPLKYIRKRTEKLATVLIIAVWVLSFLICLPPWFVPGWEFSENPYSCGYVGTLSYRIYSAFGSFYIPLLVMLFVYYKIFRVASRREAMFRGANYVATGGDDTKSRSSQSFMCRDNANSVITNDESSWRGGSLKIRGASPSDFRQHWKSLRFGGLRRNNDTGASSPQSLVCGSLIIRSSAQNRSTKASKLRRFSSLKDQRYMSTKPDAVDCTTKMLHSHGGHFAEVATVMRHVTTHAAKSPEPAPDSETENERDESSDCSTGLAQMAKHARSKTEPSRLMSRAAAYRNNLKPLKQKQEKSIYIKERKALKTIGIIVLGFICCWFPFFALYLLQSACPRCAIPSILESTFLWLGYSNSVINPLIYTCYNSSFRKCFKELFMCRCFGSRRARHRRFSEQSRHAASIKTNKQILHKAH